MSIESGQGIFYLILDACGLQQVPVGISRNGKTMWDSHAFGCKLLIHLSEGGVFSANHRDILDNNIIEP